ncbi:MAG: antibiotic biosynthesis monooxygenase [Verrucomicrobiaceae bacterium]|nr:MAG: antibiotic biosynthesis monooxygenase [Verrucomicrobiaceae bacterium]
MSEDIHIAITRRVRPGHLDEFERLLAEFSSRSLAEPGARGVHFIRPPADAASPEYGILHSFAGETARDAFYRSALYQKWIGDIAPLTEGEASRHELSGLEAWFRHSGKAPPRWKMAVATVLGVYPTSLFLNTVVAPHIKGLGLHHLLTGFLMSLCMVACLTWLVMPNITRFLHRWLHPEAATRTPKNHDS